MRCVGSFKFKSLTNRDGGEFKNSKGELIKYDPSYSLKVDEITNDGIFERLFKVPLNSPVLEHLKNKKPYEDLKIEFDVDIYSNRVSLKPVGIQ